MTRPLQQMLLCLLWITTAIGCATAQEQQSIAPNIGIQLHPLARHEYRIGDTVSGSATVKVTRTPLQKFLPFLFGIEVVAGDQQANVSMGNAESVTIRGTVGSGTSSASLQLASIVDTLSSAGGTIFGGSAATHATRAAYFRAIEQNKDVDFLLEPKVSVSMKTNSSLLPFLTDEEEATVTIVGRPVTVLTDAAIEAKVEDRAKREKQAAEMAAATARLQSAAATATSGSSDETEPEVPTKKKKKKKKKSTEP